MSQNEVSKKKAARFSNLLEQAATLPMVRIDRESYLRSALSRHCNEEQIEKAISETPAAAGIPASVIKSAANDSINFETSKVTALSTAAGLPGILWLPATVTGDMAQYVAHVLRIAQKLAYLYSWPNLFSETGEKMDDGTESVLTLFVGVMVGVQGATVAVEKLAVIVAERVATELPKHALTKGALYPAVKSVAASLGVKMTTRTFASGLSKVVPVLGAAVSGGITLGTYLPMAKRLQKHLASLEITKRDETSIVCD